MWNSTRTAAWSASNRVPDHRSVSDPILHIVAGPNGAGKTTFYEQVIAPIPLEFVNADVIAAREWPGDEAAHGYQAAAIAAALRDEKLADRASFATETVFSHSSKVELVRRAVEDGYKVTLHVILIPEDLAVARVANRVFNGGHSVPESKIRERHRRLWTHVLAAIELASVAHLYDNTSARNPFRLVATYAAGQLTNEPQWPPWTPKELTG